MNYCYYLLLCLVVIFYRAFSFTCLAPMQFIGTKESVYTRKEFDSYKTGLGHLQKLGKLFQVKHLCCRIITRSRSLLCFPLWKSLLISLPQTSKYEKSLLIWLVPRRLSIDVNLRAKEGGKEKTGETLPPLLSRPFPWSLALLHQSLTFRARLCSQKKCEKRSASSG